MLSKISPKNPEKDSALSSQLVYKTLCQDIINHRILPWEHLFEHQIAERFNVSRTPVRTALLQLASEGFVEVVPRKGAVVKGLSVKGLTDLFQIRKALEKMATECACGNQELVTRLKQILDGSKEAKDTDNKRRFTKLDEQFHDEIIKCTGNNELIDMFKVLNQKTLIYRLRAMELPKQMMVSLSQHSQIVEKIAADDVAAAGELAAAHVGTAFDMLKIFMLR